MKQQLTSLWNLIKLHPLYALLVVVALILLLWFFSANARNSISSWWFQRGVTAEQKELQESKALATDLLKQLQAEKEVTAAERAKREIAEKVLADKTLTANEKLKAYEAAINKVPITSAPADTDALCQRAAALGISCQ